MVSWFLNHVAGGLVTGILVAGTHLVLSKRHTRKTADSQTAHLDEKTDAQTQALKGGSEEKAAARRRRHRDHEAAH